MCDMCKANGGEMIGCQDCGALICFDVEEVGDDHIRGAYVTTCGDVKCAPCGMRDDREREQAEEAEAIAAYGRRDWR